MRRNLDLIKAILLWLEQQPDPWCEPPSVIEGFKHDRVDYHLNLCEEAGFIRRNRPGARPQRVQLTWKGHEELERIRQS